MVRLVGDLLDSIAISHIFAASQERARLSLVNRERPEVEIRRLLVHAARVLVAGAIERVSRTSSELHGATDDLHAPRDDLRAKIDAKRAVILPERAVDGGENDERSP